LFLHPVALDLYAALLAVIRVGAVALFVDPSARRDTVRAVMDRMRPRGFFASPKAHLWRLLHPAVRAVPCAWTTVPWVPGTRWPDSGREEGIAGCGADAPALITFTSGSTGQPKAVVRSHGFLLAQLEALRHSIRLEPGETDLVTLPVFALANLAGGLTSVIADTDLARPGQADAARVGDQLRREGVTRCAASPAFFEALVRGGADLGGMRKIFTGGAPVFPRLLDCLAAAAPSARVEAVYGSTEAEPVSHVERDEITPADREAMRSGSGLLVGRPVPQIRVAILANRWGTPLGPFTEAEFRALELPEGDAGEIVVAGDHVLRGYLDGRGDEETKIRVGDGVWHRTGDAGWRDAAGRLWLLGRAGETIRRERGDLHPFAVETALSFLPGVRRSALVGMDGKAVLAVEPAEARDEAAAQVAWAGIDRATGLERIPVDRRHQAKVDYPALRECLRRGALG
jgi:acyl-CoA synthetase (AMP-forming)/AMP-acid ligase II